MTNPERTNEANQGASAQKPCIMSHEQVYLVWVHQADGYSYFKCAHCDFKSPDLELGTVGRLLKAKDAEKEAMLKEQHEIQKGLVRDIQHYRGVAEDIERLEAEKAELQEKLKGLREALKVYANSDRWSDPPGRDVAQEALKQFEDVKPKEDGE